MSTPTRKHRFDRIAWVLAGLCTLGALARLAFWLPNKQSPISLFDLVEALGWGLAIPVVFSAFAVLIITRRPSNRVGWLMMLIALATVNPVGAILERLPATPSALTTGLWLLLWFDGWSWIPVIFPVFLIPLHFPGGRPPSPGWNWVNWLALGMWLFFISFGSFLNTVGPINGNWRLPNPIGFIPDQVWGGPILIIWGIGLITLVSTSLVSLLIRYRRASVGERQQIKWLLYAGAVFAAGYVLTYPLSTEGQSVSPSGWLDLLLVVSILTFPVAIAIGILRYRLYDIDIIIRRTLVYTVLTALLALVYFGGVVLLQRLVGALTGVEQSPLAVAVSTLVIVVLFTPLRRRIQEFIDRRFFRKKYDAQQVLARFALTARDETNLESLTGELVRVVQETLQPEDVSVWLNSKRSTFVASDAHGK